MLWLDRDFANLIFSFAHMGNCRFPRATQVLSSPATLEFVPCNLTLTEAANTRCKDHFASVKELNKAKSSKTEY